MRILHVLAGAATRSGGAVAFAGEAAADTARAGEQVRVFTSDIALAPWGWLQRQRRALPEDLHPSLREVQTDVFEARFPRRLARSPAMGRALRDRVAEFDVVHIHNLWQYPQHAAFKAARDAGVPWIVSPHGSLDPYLRRRGRVRKAISTALWQREMLERAALVHVTTSAEERLISDIATEVPREVVPCAIHIEEFADLPPRSEFRERHLDGYDGALVVFLGRVTEKKGVDVLVRAFAHVVKRQPARLAIVGPDDSGLRPKLERLAEELGIGADVVFTDALYGRDRLAALSATDAWALSSHTENFGIAVVEAMAAGCAVVISPGVNLSDDVIAADAGVVADAEPRAFAEGLLEVLADPDRARRLREVAPEFASGYDWSRVTPRLIEMYRRAVGAGAASSVGA
jgi:glycosyltransferase involved in cell wall biosynthesis